MLRCKLSITLTERLCVFWVQHLCLHCTQLGQMQQYFTNWFHLIFMLVLLDISRWDIWLRPAFALYFFKIFLHKLFLFPLDCPEGLSWGRSRQLLVSLPDSSHAVRPHRIFNDFNQSFSLCSLYWHKCTYQKIHLMKIYNPLVLVYSQKWDDGCQWLGEKQKNDYYLMGAHFQFGKMRRILEAYDCDGCRKCECT